MILIDSIVDKHGFNIPWADGRFLYMERHEAREMFAELQQKIKEWDAQKIPQQGDPADEGWKCGLCGKGKEVDHYGCFRAIPSR